MSARALWGRQPKKETRDDPVARGVRAVRTELKMTQAQFATALNVVRVLVSKWENGIHRPNDRMLRTMQDMLMKSRYDPVGFLADNPQITDPLSSNAVEVYDSFFPEEILPRRKGEKNVEDPDELSPEDLFREFSGQ